MSTPTPIPQNQAPMGNDIATISIPLSSRRNVHYLDQFFGTWCVDEMARMPAMAYLQSDELAVNMVERRRVADPSDSYETLSGGVAQIEIRGLMTKRGSSLSDAGSTVVTRKQLRSAARDESIHGILLVIESPGGTAAGTKELADEIAAAAAIKPVYAYIEDIGASAAYYAASQATEIYANGPAMVGSIGTYMVIVDASKAAEDSGLVVHVIQSGAFKGAGEPGTEITPDQLAYFQQMIDEINKGFISSVAAGRKMTQDKLSAVSDGRVFLAAKAKQLGLVDDVLTYEQTLAKLKGKIMDKLQATSTQIRSALPGVSDAMVLSLIEDGSTLSDAKDAYIVQLVDDKKTLTAEIAEFNLQVDKMEATAAAQSLQIKQLKNLPGVEPIGQVTGQPVGSSTSAREEWDLAVQAKVNVGMTKHAAAARVSKECPELRQRMIEEANAA